MSAIREEKPEKYVDPSWVEGVARKRPETAIVLQTLIMAGIRRGHVTAEDAHHIPVSHPNVRGVAMKLLAKCGFAKEYPTRGTTENSHGHWMFVWKLSNHSAARSVLDRIVRIVVPARPQPTGQMELF